MSNDSQVWECGLPLETRETIDRIRSSAAPEDSLQRALGTAIAIDQGGVSGVENVRRRRVTYNPGRVSIRRIGGVTVAVAATVLIGVWALSGRDSWAQVVEAVSSRPWMRLTMQRPRQELPQGEQFPEVVIWLRGDRQVAAMTQRGKAVWWDLSRNDEWSFSTGEGEIRLIDGSVRNQHELNVMTSLLDQFEAPSNDAESEPLRLVDQSRRKVTIDGREWDEYVFEFTITPRRGLRVAVRVDRETKRPVELRQQQIVDGNDGDYVVHFAIDYPEDGPDDIYALGAPDSATIHDLRDLRNFFRPGDRVQPADYEAIVFRTIAGRPLTQAWDAARYRHNSGGTTAELVDFEQNTDLNQRVAEGAEGPGKSPSPEWWAEQFDRLKMEHQEPGAHRILPHNRCYLTTIAEVESHYLYGSPDAFDSVHNQTLDGIQTLELRGPKVSVWLDIQRDMIVRRCDSLNEDGSYSVIQYDEVRKGPDGTWFPTRWRDGQVAERGAPLSDELKPDEVSTTIWFMQLSFIGSAETDVPGGVQEKPGGRTEDRGGED